MSTCLCESAYIYKTTVICEVISSKAMCVKVEDSVQFVETLDERLTCSICKNAFNEPWQTSCGHRFCKKCLDGSFGYVSEFISKRPLY